MVAKTKWIIGSAADCDLVVHRDVVSGRHCQLSWLAPVFVLEDLRSTNGTFVNGEKIVAPTIVTAADEISLASQVPMPWPAAAETAKRETINIGRDSDNDVILDVLMVSGRHARLIVEKGRTFLEDAGSSNGTTIGPPFRSIQREELSTKDIVLLGSYEITAKDLLEKARNLNRKRSQPERRDQSRAEKKANIGRDAVTAPANEQPSRWRSSHLAFLAMIGLFGCLCIAMVLSRPANDSEPRAESSQKPTPAETNPIQVSLPPPKDSTAVAITTAPTVATPNVKEGPVSPPVAPASADRLKLNRDAVVWVGIRVRDPMGSSSALFPLATAFAVKRNVLLTTAWIASELERHSKIETRQPVAFCNGEEFPIQTYQPHPRFNVQEPTSDTSVEHNVGALHLKDALGTCEVAEPTEVTSLSLDSPLSLIGFKTSLGPKEPFDPLKVTKQDVPLRLQSTLLNRPNSPIVFKVVGNIATQEGAQPLMEGAPIFGMSGRVVGILAPTTQSTKMVSATACRSLLNP